MAWHGIAQFLNSREVSQLNKFVDEVEKRHNRLCRKPGRPEMIMSYPLHMNYRAVPPVGLANLLITAGFFRLSLGFEGAPDVIEGLKRVLDELMRV
jgi:cystathionine beta-lyase/cystathionine gamma-synthase